MRRMTAIALFVALTNGAAAQGVTPQPPGVAPPVPAPPAQSAPPQPSGAMPKAAPPRRDSFGDRVRDCLHAFPLAQGQPGQPADRDAFVRQCAN